MPLNVVPQTIIRTAALVVSGTRRKRTLDAHAPCPSGETQGHAAHHVCGGGATSAAPETYITLHCSVDD